MPAVEPARRARRRLRDRPGPARPGSHPPLHARDRLGRARLRADVPARARPRTSFGGPLAEKQFVQDFIAKSRMEIDSARLMVLHAAWKMDTEGKRAARQDISMIKVIAAQMHQRVLDRAMQVHGALGDVRRHAAGGARGARAAGCGIADGPDEVHKMVIALRELNRFKPRRGGRGLSTAGATLTPPPTAVSPRSSAPSSRRSATSLRARSSSGRSRTATRTRSPPAWASSAGTGLQIPEEYGGSGGSLPRRDAVPRGDHARPDPGGGLRRHADRGRRAEPLRHRGAEARPVRARGRRAATLAIAMSEPEAGLRRGRPEDARAARERRVGAERGEDVVLVRPQGEPHPDRVPHAATASATRTCR